MKFFFCTEELMRARTAYVICAVVSSVSIFASVLIPVIIYALSDDAVETGGSGGASERDRRRLGARARARDIRIVRASVWLF